jgi:hypothetical protein
LREIESGRANEAAYAEVERWLAAREKQLSR